jgi:DNA-binding SARP family transcriptional activator/ActR/RegA family two-component response regulator
MRAKVEMKGVPLPKYRLALLGRFELSRTDGPVELPNKKLAALLAYLACTAPEPQSREKLATLLWGSHFETLARQNLRQALFRLRRALGEGALIGDGEDISLTPGVVDCDVARRQALIRDGSRASLAAAVDLYKGRFLSDVNISEEAWADWVGAERQRLEGSALDALVRLGEIELAAGHADKALETAHRTLAINNLREDAHRLILQALAAAGRKAEAFKHYQDLVALLELELSTEPDAATKSLVAVLASTQPPGRSSTVGEIAKPALPQRVEERRVRGEATGDSMKVLITDDHALIREALHAVLKQLKHETVIFEASNGRQAMRIVEEHPDLSLVLLDINLPDRDGFSVLGELRERFPTVAVIILSALDDQDQVKRAFSLGALGFIPKTTEREVILNAIRLVLSGGIYIPSEILDCEERAASRQ